MLRGTACEICIQDIHRLIGSEESTGTSLVQYLTELKSLVAFHVDCAGEPASLPSNT